MHSLIQKSFLTRKLFHRLIPSGLALLLGYSLFGQSWAWVRVPEFRPRFADLRIVTSTASCIQDGTWSSVGPTCDPLGRAFNYPIVWARVFAALNLGESYTTQIGLTLGVLVIATLTIPLFKLAEDPSLQWRMVSTYMCVGSPPVLLQLERGNTDGVILVLFALTSLLFARMRPLAVVFAVVASALKLFPVVTAMAFIPRHRRDWSIVGFVGLPSLLLISGESLVRLTEIQEPPGEYRFGSLLILYHLLPAALNYPRLWVLLVGVSLTVTPALFLWRFRKSEIRYLSDALTKGGSGTSLFLFGALLFVGSYVSGSRYDYSQQFLVMAVLGIALLRIESPLVTALFWLAPISLWGAFWLNPESLLGDTATSACAWILLAVLIQNRGSALREILRARTG